VASTSSAFSQGYVNTLITFDDLPELSIEAISNGYGGLQWDNFWLLGGGGYDLPNVTIPKSGGYWNGIVSPKNVAFNAYGLPSEITSLTPFYMESGYFTGALSDGLQLRIEAFFQGSLVGDTTYTLDTSGPLMIAFNLPVVDQIRFTSFGGIPHSESATGDQFVIDNLSISFVPEPSIMTLGILGIAMLVLQRRKQLHVT
jgi:hypothetical protein